MPKLLTRFFNDYIHRIPWCQVKNAERLFDRIFYKAQNEKIPCARQWMQPYVFRLDFRTPELVNAQTGFRCTDEFANVHPDYHVLQPGSCSDKISTTENPLPFYEHNKTKALSYVVDIGLLKDISQIIKMDYQRGPRAQFLEKFAWEREVMISELIPLSTVMACFKFKVDDSGVTVVNGLINPHYSNQAKLKQLAGELPALTIPQELTSDCWIARPC